MTRSDHKAASSLPRVSFCDRTRARRVTCVGVLPQGACDVSMTEKTAIVVRTRWPVASVFFAFIFRTFVTIDGVTSLLSPRGNHVLPVAPGTHEVQVSLGRSIGGRGLLSGARIQVDVAQGEAVHLLYRVPFLYLYEDGSLELIE